VSTLKGYQSRNYPFFQIFVTLHPSRLLPPCSSSTQAITSSGSPHPRRRLRFATQSHDEHLSATFWGGSVGILVGGRSVGPQDRSDNGTRSTIGDAKPRIDEDSAQPSCPLHISRGFPMQRFPGHTWHTARLFDRSHRHSRSPPRQLSGMTPHSQMLGFSQQYILSLFGIQHY
jgi:hypothetical protein